MAAGSVPLAESQVAAVSSVNLDVPGGAVPAGEHQNRRGQVSEAAQLVGPQAAVPRVHVVPKIAYGAGFITTPGVPNRF